MKFRYLPLLCVALVFGCSKPAATGNVTSNSTDVKPSVDATGSAPSSTTTTTGSSKSETVTKSSTTGSTDGPKGGATTTTGGPATTAAPDLKNKPGTTPPANPPGKGTATTPPLNPPPGQATPDQMKAQQEAMKKLAAENGAKAEKATKTLLDGVKGTYHVFIDESKIPATAKSQPGYADQLSKLKAISVVVGNDGSVLMKGISQGPVKEVSGITSKIDGKPVFVLNNPTPKAGQSSKQYAPVTITDGGGTFQFGPFTFKRG